MYIETRDYGSESMGIRMFIDESASIVDFVVDDEVKVLWAGIRSQLGKDLVVEKRVFDTFLELCEDTSE